MAIFITSGAQIEPQIELTVCKDLDYEHRLKFRGTVCGAIAGLIRKYHSPYPLYYHPDEGRGGLYFDDQQQFLAAQTECGINPLIPDNCPKTQVHEI